MKLIDVAELKKTIEHEFEGVTVYDVSGSKVVYDFFDIIDRQPIVKERAKGKWITRNEDVLYPTWERYKCSICGAFSDQSNFCPNCGADMRNG